MNKSFSRLLRQIYELVILQIDSRISIVLLLIELEYEKDDRDLIVKAVISLIAIVMIFLAVFVIGWLFLEVPRVTVIPTR